MAVSAILATRGELNVSTSLVDDDGVDLVSHRRGHTAILAVQVKARMSDGALASTGRVQANVRDATYRPRPDLDMLFVVVDPAEAASAQRGSCRARRSPSWCPQPTARAGGCSSRRPSRDTADRWRRYRLMTAELAHDYSIDSQIEVAHHS